jgi:hypothetical protein
LEKGYATLCTLENYCSEGKQEEDGRTGYSD